MRRNLNTYTVMILLFVLILMGAGVLDGLLSDTLYYLAFILPPVLGILVDNRIRRAEAEHDREYPEPENLLSFDKGGVKMLAPCVFPTVLIILGISYLTAFIITSLTGVERAVDVGGSLPIALLEHALVPTLLEELLFRFMPMRMLARYGTRFTVIVSSVYFALAHTSLFSIPYALVAGVIFMILDIVCESIWPSVILHFINNAVSVLLLFFAGSESAVSAILISLSVISAVSVVFVIIMKKTYAKEIKRVLLSSGDGSVGYTPIALAVPTLFIAMAEFM